MLETYGELIFTYSHNVQVRKGDPVRLLDFEAYEANRVGAGLADVEIAGKLGLSREQVTVIRNIVERRKVRTDTYHRLNTLGGGRRFRAEREPEAIMPNTDLSEAIVFDPARVQHYVEQGYWTDETLVSLLNRHAKDRPDHPVIVAGERTITYRELAVSVRNISEGLRGLGIAPGDVVAVQLPNLADTLVAYLAITAAPAVMSTIYMPYQSKEMEVLLAHSKARAFIGLETIGTFSPAKVVSDLSAKLDCLNSVLTVDGAVDGCIAFHELDVARVGGGAELEPPVASDPFLLLYTSGTTASPKGVPLTYHTMLANARGGVREHGVTADARILSAAPFGHLFGLYAIHLAMSAGATNVLLEAFTPPALAETIEKLGPTHLLAAPTHIAACLGGGFFEGRDLASLELAILSGAQVPTEIARAFEEIMPNGRVTQLWGMTELQAGTYTRPDTPLEKVAGTAGRPSPGAEVRVVDENGVDAGPGVEGELQTRGCNLFSGYYDNPEANAAAFTEDGWFRTGDLAVIDGNGDVALTGRTKDIINRGGVKYNPLDIERLLDRHPAVAQSAIVPVPDPVLGERACAFIVAAGGTTPSLETLCQYLLDEGIAKTKLPERLEVIDTMPLTATRKIIKGRLTPKDDA